MSLVFDAHSHCFPPMGSGPCYPDICVKATQYHMRHVGGQFLRYDDKIPLDATVPLGDKDGVSWLPELHFRVGRFGRAELTYNGDDYYFHFVPPTLGDSSCSAEFLVTQMDYAGVDRALLQNDLIYGRLDDYLADCMQRYPDRLVALAQVDEWVGGTPEQLSRARRQIQELGYAGLYFATGGFCQVDFRLGVNDPSLKPLWELVAELDVPIHWYASELRRPRLKQYLVEIAEFNQWAQTYPDVTCVLTHGLENLRIDLDRPDRFSVPPEILELIQRPNWYIELMLHKMCYDSQFPPYHPELPGIVELLVKRLGADKIVWGSDMPSCENYVTYRQSQILFKTKCGFLTTDQKDAILGGNLARLYPL